MEILTHVIWMLLWLASAAISFFQFRRSETNRKYAFDRIVLHNELVPCGPWHIAYNRHSRRCLLWRFMFLLDSVLFIMEVHHVFILITA